MGKLLAEDHKITAAALWEDIRCTSERHQRYYIVGGHKY